MHIVGGLYRELCDVPAWDCTLGSGGRAALAASSLVTGVELTAYASAADAASIKTLQMHGITTHLSSRPSPIVFAYFHPLSSPHIEPPRGMINQQKPLSVTADTVLRFGLIEGDAVIRANRAIYDPQTWRNPPAFSANGSTANELALVLNELEARQSSGCDDLELAAKHLMVMQGASVVVIKQGARGASVYEASGKFSKVPAYRSSSVFKIGTGDVFTAVFAVYWARGLSTPEVAADLASRSVSIYCDTRAFEFDESALMRRQPVSSELGSAVRIEGNVQSLGQRYVMEEARFALQELGIGVVNPMFSSDTLDLSADAILLINDDLSSEALVRLADDSARLTPVIAFNDRAEASSYAFTATEITNDFATAIYLAAWAAGGAIAVRQK